jgi:type II secretory pathway pseudopilin PulG
MSPLFFTYMFVQKSKKTLAILLSATVFFSGCGSTVEEISTQSNTVFMGEDVSAITPEMEILDALPEGVMAFAVQQPSVMKSKVDALFEYWKYLPEEMQSDLEKQAQEEFEKTPKEVVEEFVGALEYSAFIQPKKEDLLFAEMAINPVLVAEEGVCGIIDVSAKKSYLKMYAEDFDMSPEDFSDENLQKKLDEIQPKIPDFIDLQVDFSEDNIRAKVMTAACDEASKNAAQQFFDAVQNQDQIAEFSSVDKKFFAPFLAKGNINAAKAAIAVGESQFYTKAEQEGFDPKALKKLKGEILDPWGRTNFAKMIMSFESLSYVSAPLEGNMMDRKSEWKVEFADEEMATLFAEMQSGKIASRKLWLSEETDYTAKVSQDGAVVYSFVQYKNAEYPSVFAEFGSGAVVAIGVIGILSTGAVAMFSSAQEKARDAVRLKDLQSAKVALMQYSLENDDLYPESLDELVTDGFLSVVPTDPKTKEEYEYIFFPDRSGFTLRANPESSDNISRYSDRFYIEECATCQPTSVGELYRDQ